MILVLNAGSSSVKFAAYETGRSGPTLLLRGMLDRHADDGRFLVKDAAGKPIQNDWPPPDSTSDISAILLKGIVSLLGGRALSAIGHRIVHGGPDFAAPVLIDAEIIRKLELLTPLAPQHQPGCLDPTRQILSLRPESSFSVLH